jgi:predicted dehydrogenase
LGPRVVPRGSPSVRLGLIGAGRWGRRIITTVDSLPDTEITGICSRTRPHLDGREIPWFPLWPDLIASGLCEGLIVASPPETHVPIALEALRAGLAVFIEKPLALSLADATRLSEVAGALPSCPAILVDHTHLFAPSYQKLKSLIRSPIAEIRTRGCSFEPWRPYSSLFDFGPHDLAMVLDLLGFAPDDVGCRCVSEVVHDSGERRVHRLFEIDLRFGSVRASCTVGNASREKQRSLEVLCENGDRLVYDDVRAVDKLRFNGSPVEVGDGRPLSLAILAFRDAIAGVYDARLGLTLPMRVQSVLEKCITG